MKFILALLLVSPFANASQILKCNSELIRMIEADHFPMREGFGGFQTPGGFTAIDAFYAITPQVQLELMKEMGKIPSTILREGYLRYTLMPDDADKNLVAEFLRAHAKYALAAIRKTHPDYVLVASTFTVTNEPLQEGFHDHGSDPNFQLERGRWTFAALTMNGDGTVFRELNGRRTYSSRDGETILFNTETMHKSPRYARERLFVIHFFARPPQD